jgi:hypothetical protein
MHRLLACSAYLPEQSTFGQNGRTNLNGTKKERKTHKGQLTGRYRNEERSRKERKKNNETVLT